MEEKKKRRYPTSRQKLHELKAKLVLDIADKQEMLLEVTKLAKHADNAAIIDMAQNYNITPEAFSTLMQSLQDGNINMPLETAEEVSVKDAQVIPSSHSEEDAQMPTEALFPLAGNTNQEVLQEFLDNHPVGGRYNE